MLRGYKGLLAVDQLGLVVHLDLKETHLATQNSIAVVWLCGDFSFGGMNPQPASSGYAHLE